ncbi:hypothetical protein KQI84_16205 [bacterium]|nr:hypothetical protein [bacterium]
MASLAVVTVAPAQNVLRRARGERTMLAADITMTDYMRTTNDGRLEAQLLRVDLAARNATLEAILPERGPWSGEHLEEMAKESEAKAILAWELEPDLSGAQWMQGLLFVRGELLSWPATGPVAAVLPEGAVRLMEPAELSGTIITSDDAEIPLGSINGAPSADLPALYSGAFSGSSVAGASWPEGTLAVPLQPAPGNAHPAISIWNDAVPTSHRRWLAGTPKPLDRYSLNEDDWALIIPLGLSPEHRQALMQARTLYFDVELPGAVKLSVLTLQGENLLMRGGEFDGEVGEQAIRTALATDRSGSWVMLSQAGRIGRREVAVTRREMADFLAEQGATEAIELAADRRRMIADMENEEWTRELGMLSTRVAVAAVPREATMVGRDGEMLRPISIGVVRASNEGVMRNGPGALIDGQAAWSRGLGQFWAAGPRDAHMVLSDASFRSGEDESAGAGNHWVELKFYSPARIRAVDIVHAESCGFSPQFDVKSFALSGQDQNGHGWKPLAVVQHDEPVARERIWIDSDAMLDSIRLEVLEPNFLSRSPTVRIAEIVVWGE